MGLDLLISEKKEICSDFLGRKQYILTELTNLKDCFETLKLLSNDIKQGMVNHSQYKIREDIFCNVLQKLINKKETSKYSKNFIISDLDYEINKLNNFIKENKININKNNYRYFDVYTLW